MKHTKNSLKGGPNVEPIKLKISSFTQVEKFISNPTLATELFQTADRLSCIKPDALKTGRNRYRIDVGWGRETVKLLASS